MIALVASYNAAPHTPPTRTLTPTAGVDLLTDAAGGDVAAAVESAALAAAGAAAALAARAATAVDDNRPLAPPPPPPPEEVEKVAVEVDLGAGGEPAGVSTLSFRPLLARSDVFVLNVPVPLGLLIEECALNSTGARTKTSIRVTGTLPGYGAHNLLQPDDLVLGVTAYAEVVAGASMWQQAISYEPQGTVQLKRLLFRTEDATYDDIRSAIASHRESDGGDGIVTLILERPVNVSTPLAPREQFTSQIVPLSDVVMADLKKPRTANEYDRRRD